MKYTTILILILLSFSTFSQTIEELEYDLSWYHSSEKYGDRIDKARLLIKKDPFNEKAVEYICRYYDDRDIDSVSIFFNNLISKYPNNPYSYILRSDLIFLEIDFRNDSLYFNKKIEYLKKAYSLDKGNIDANYSLAEIYYRDFIKANNNIEVKGYLTNDFYLVNSIILDYFPLKPNGLFEKSADSALYYFTNISNLSFNLNAIVYYPIKQLESYLKINTKYIKNSPALVSDNCYFPIWYFADLKWNWERDYTIDYLYKIKSSKSSADWLKVQLEDLQEDCLYDCLLNKHEEIYRFTWLRSFDPPISVRMSKSNSECKIRWKIGKGQGGYEPLGLQKSGSRKISELEWNQFISLLAKVKFDDLPSLDYIPMTDGATWTLEKKTKTGYKAYKTNLGYSKIRTCCLYLVGLTDLIIDKKDIY